MDENTSIRTDYNHNEVNSIASICVYLTGYNVGSKLSEMYTLNDLYRIVPDTKKQDLEF